MEEDYLFCHSLCGLIEAELLPDCSLKIQRSNKKANAFLGISDVKEHPVFSLFDSMDSSNQNFLCQIFSKLKKDGDEEPFLLQLHQGVIEGTIGYRSTGEGDSRVLVQFLQKGENIAIRRREAQQKEVLESVLNSIQSGVIRYTYLGDEEEVTLVNQAAWRMLGYPDEHSLRRQGLEGIVTRIHPQDQKLFLKTRYMLKEDGDLRNCEFRFQSDHGEIWLSVQFQSFRDARNHPVVQLMLNDISAKKELERKREERTSEAVNSAYEAAMKANAAKSDFLSSMSHDIRTPLNAIIGLQQIMAMNLEDRSQLEECLKDMKEASGMLLDLINDVLDVSRIESGKLPIAHEIFTMEELLRNVSAVVAPQMKERGHQFSIENELKGNTYKGDITNIQKILTNLLSNAMKFTPQKGHISLKLWSDTFPKSDVDQVHFQVSDDGIGMSTEFVKKIFQPFEREENPANGEIQGTGLGMSIVDNLVHLMDGWIEIQSEPGKGSAFHVALPLIPKADHSFIQVQKERDLDGIKPDLSGRRILVVDDHEINRKIAVKLLEDLGACVEFAENGMQGLWQYEAHEEDWYDLIFMDIRMPVMDGYEAARRIRSSEKRSYPVPIVAMTANAFDEDVRKALHAGMNEHLAKPIQLPKLYDTLRRILSR